MDSYTKIIEENKLVVTWICHGTWAINPICSGEKDFLFHLIIEILPKSIDFLGSYLWLCLGLRG